MTTVCNKTTDRYDVNIGRPSIYGNPYKIGKDGTRKDVVEKFRQYFYKRITWDDEYLNSILLLKGKRLGCFCKPNDCHGDVICEYLNNIV